MKVIAAEVAAHLGMLTHKAATESRATTGEMASAEPAAHGRRPESAHASAAEPAHVSATHVSAAEPAAHMSATPEPPAVSTPTTVSTPASPAARQRISGQSPRESAAVAKTIMVLRSTDTPSDATASIRLITQSGHCTKVWTNGEMKIAIHCIQY